MQRLERRNERIGMQSGRTSTSIVRFPRGSPSPASTRRSARLAAPNVARTSREKRLQMKSRPVSAYVDGPALFRFIPDGLLFSHKRREQTRARLFVFFTFHRNAFRLALLSAGRHAIVVARFHDLVQSCIHCLSPSPTKESVAPLFASVPSFKKQLQDRVHGCSLQYHFGIFLTVCPIFHAALVIFLVLSLDYHIVACFATEFAYRRGDLRRNNEKSRAAPQFPATPPRFLSLAPLAKRASCAPALRHGGMRATCRSGRSSCSHRDARPDTPPRFRASSLPSTPRKDR